VGELAQQHNNTCAPPPQNDAALQVTGAQLALAVEALLHPEAPLALRLSGQLLLGLVRLYEKQVSFLQQVRASELL
jgi:hypothetical protein